MMEIEVHVTKLQFSPSSGFEAEQIEEEWLAKQMIFHKEMEDITAVLILVDSSQDWTFSLGATDFPSGSHVSSSFIVKPPRSWDQCSVV